MVYRETVVELGFTEAEIEEIEAAITVSYRLAVDPNAPPFRFPRR